MSRCRPSPSRCRSRPRRPRRSGARTRPAVKTPVADRRRLRLCICKAASGELLGGSAMIRPPRRSVTRFFIPLIDVLILLFCIFLLMPIVEEGGAGPSGKVRLTPGEAQVMRQRLDHLQRRVAELEQTRESPRVKQLLRENERLKEEATRSAAERTSLRHLEIDPNTGAIIYDNPDRKEARFPR